MRALVSMTAILLLAGSSKAPFAATTALSGISLYGIELGKALAIPECKSSLVSAGEGFCFKAEANTVANLLPPAPHEMREFSIHFEKEHRPSISRFESFNVQVADGVVQEIGVLTNGLGSQAEALKQLTEKFGKPDRLDVVQVQNSFGAKFDAVHADWGTVGGNMVQLIGTLSKLDNGVIVATTPLAQKAHLIQAEHSSGPKL